MAPNDNSGTKRKNLEEDLRKEAERYLQKRNSFAKYFESDEFNQLLGIIKQHDQIDQEHLLYKIQVIDGLSEEKFSRVVHAIYQQLESHVVRDQGSEFPKYHIDYEGIRFHLMIGQGSTFWTTKQE
ncbi:hypothetical protein HYX13_03100 [Candidatus Woesearchaeota archaeon]|nr:hypothetical protein [Candidatus Woesearchaeota archaeon]